MMGFNTVYFLVSVALLFGSVYMLCIMLMLRRTGRNISGNIIDKKHPAYGSMVRFASNGRIAITALLILLFALNVYRDALVVKSIYAHSEATILFITAPAVNVLAIVLVTRSVRQTLKR